MQSAADLLLASEPSLWLQPCPVVPGAAGWGGGDAATASPWSWIDPGAFALVGAGAFMSSVTRLTVALAVIMVEISDDVHMLLPVLVAIMVAKWVADAASHSLYHALLELKCVPFLSPEPVSRYSLDLLPVSTVMRSPVVSLKTSMKVRDTICLYAGPALISATQEIHVDVGHACSVTCYPVYPDSPPYICLPVDSAAPCHCSCYCSCCTTCCYCPLQVGEIQQALRDTTHNGFPIVRDTASGQVFLGLISRPHLLALLQRFIAAHSDGAGGDADGTAHANGASSHGRTSGMTYQVGKGVFAGIQSLMPCKEMNLKVLTSHQCPRCLAV